MEENTGSSETPQEKAQKEENTPNKCRCSKEFICILAAAFLGAFLAVYFAADQALYRRYKSDALSIDKFQQHMMKDFNRLYERRQRDFERGLKKFEKEFDRTAEKHFDNKNKANPFRLQDKIYAEKMPAENVFDDVFSPLMQTSESWNRVQIKTEIDDDEYKIIVDLNAFNGDDSRINYNVSKKKLTVFGRSQSEGSGFKQEMSFSQDFLLPSDADISKIKKKKEDGRAVIEIPLRRK